MLYLDADPFSAARRNIETEVVGDESTPKAHLWKYKMTVGQLHRQDERVPRNVALNILFRAL